MKQWWIIYIILIIVGFVAVPLLCLWDVYAGSFAAGGMVVLGVVHGTGYPKK